MFKCYIWRTCDEMKTHFQNVESHNNILYACMYTYIYYIALFDETRISLATHLMTKSGSKSDGMNVVARRLRIT